MDISERLSKFIDEHTDEMVADTMKLCAVNSEKGAYEEGKPYGEGPFKALNEAMDLCEKYGFDVTNYDNYVAAVDMNDKESGLDILAHMDVVAAGDGWTVTEAYKPIVKDGRIYGRGTSDDKGPAMCALYAMRAVKELGLPLSRNCRLILGTDEECGSSDIKHYYAIEKEAPMTFSPDGEFPLINVEKGQFRGSITKSFDGKLKDRDFIYIKGGTTVNIVPGKAEAAVCGLPLSDILPHAKELEEDTGVKFSFSENEGSVVIAAEGKGAHASTPENGKNAAIALCTLVAKLPLDESERRTALLNFLELFPYGVNDGSGIGIKMSDQVSHATTCSLDIFEMTEKELYAKWDARTCASSNHENCVEPAEKSVREKGFDVETDFLPAHVVDGDSDFVKTLLACYEKYTGKKGECLAIGGGTYVHELKNGVAFGAVGDTTDTHMHGADEFMIIEEMKTAAKIYAEAIYELCK
ncbi:MAG: Sapep family Mn(2+)-dependent dipeptidase [Candidatus Avilachnospira sp.]|jgi:succinyl-diaminopimelate desuccinylase